MLHQTNRSRCARRAKSRQRGAVFVEALIVVVMLLVFMSGLLVVRDAYASKIATIHDARAAAWQAGLEGCRNGSAQGEGEGGWFSAVGTALRDLWEAAYEADTEESYGSWDQAQESGQLWLTAAKALGPLAREILGGEDLARKSVHVPVRVGEPAREVAIMKTTTVMGCNEVAQNLGTRTDMVRMNLDTLRNLLD